MSWSNKIRISLWAAGILGATAAVVLWNRPTAAGSSSSPIPQASQWKQQLAEIPRDTPALAPVTVGDSHSDDGVAAVLARYESDSGAVVGHEAAALLSLLQPGQEPLRDRWLIAIAHNWCLRDPRAFLAWVKTAALSPREGLALVESIYHDTKVAPDTTLDLIFLLPESRKGSELVTRILSQYAQLHPEATFEMAQTNLSPVEYQNFLFRTLRELQPANLNFAQAKLAEFKNQPKIYPEAVRQYTHGLMNMGYPGLQDWLIQGMSQDPAAFAPSYKDWLQVESQSNPAMAFEKISRLPLTPLRQELLDLTLYSLVRGMPEKTAAWLSRHPAAEFDRHTSTVIEAWVETDATAAMNWAMSLRSGRGKDRALQAVSDYLAETTSMEKAVQWAGMIQDPDIRAQTLRRLLAK